MMLAGNLTVLEALGLLAALTLALFPFVYWRLGIIYDRRLERHLRARGARPARERRLDQLGTLVDVDPDLERYYGTVEPLDDAEHHRHR